jgi:hypothetical protein
MEETEFTITPDEQKYGMYEDINIFMADAGAPIIVARVTRDGNRCIEIRKMHKRKGSTDLVFGRGIRIPLDDDGEEIINCAMSMMFIDE